MIALQSNYETSVLACVGLVTRERQQELTLREIG
jgi:hypothetical protein